MHLPPLECRHSSPHGPGTAPCTLHCQVPPDTRLPCSSHIHTPASCTALSLHTVPRSLQPSQPLHAEHMAHMGQPGVCCATLHTQPWAESLAHAMAQDVAPQRTPRCAPQCMLKCTPQFTPCFTPQCATKCTPTLHLTLHSSVHPSAPLIYTSLYTPMYPAMYIPNLHLT